MTIIFNRLYIYIARYYWTLRYANWHNWTLGPLTFYIETD